MAISGSDGHDIVMLADHFYHQQDRPRWKALQRVLQHRYFSRAWICPEVVVSQQPILHLGGRVFTWDSIMRTFARISDPQFISIVTGVLSNPFCNTKSFQNAKILSFLRAAASGGVRMPLGYVLSYTINFDATIEEDKIFAMLGVADRDPACAVIEKVIGKPVMEVFRAAARTLLLSPQHSVHILPLAGVGYRRLPESKDLPSWCPDWIIGRSEPRLSICSLYETPQPLHIFSDSGPPYSASGPSTPRIFPGTTPGTLMLGGAEIDIIKSVTEALRSGPGVETGTGLDAVIGHVVQHINMFIESALLLVQQCNLLHPPRSYGAGARDCLLAHPHRRPRRRPLPRPGRVGQVLPRMAGANLRGSLGQPQPRRG